jgi:hydroxymethylbilane synthase
MTRTVRVGSRGSRLARAMVAELLDRLRTAHPDVVWTQHTVMTTGDLDRTTSLGELSASGAGVFASQVEAALLAGRIDVAVHSLKDLPTRATPGTVLAVVPRRHDVRDALCGATLDTLPEGARVGTSAPRRVGQLLRARPDVCPVPVRGNVPPRLRHMRQRGWGGLLLAAAGPTLRLLGQVTSVDGRRSVRADQTGSPQDPEALGARVAEELREGGAADLLAGLRAAPPSR